MVKEEIREGIAERIHLEWCDWSLSISEKETLSPERLERWKQHWVEFAELPEDVKEQDRVWADELIKYLHSQGVVRKVERELPSRFLIITRSPQNAYEQAQRDMLKSGYVAVEPLI